MTHITIDKQVVEQALEALKMTIAFQDANTCDGYAEYSVLYPSRVTADWCKVRKAITALRAALEAKEEEPVACDCEDPNFCKYDQHLHPAPAIPEFKPDFKLVGEPYPIGHCMKCWQAGFQGEGRPCPVHDITEEK